MPIIVDDPPRLQAQVTRAFRQHWRFWAHVPDAGAVQVIGPVRAGASELLGVARRPTFPAGVCRHCGCSHFDPCYVEDAFESMPCCWADRTRRVCTNPDCLARERARVASRRARGRARKGRRS